MNGRFAGRFFVMAVSVFAVAAFAASAMAQAPKLTLKIKAEKEVKVVRNGKETIVLAPAELTTKGDVILYTIACANYGDSEATDAVISDPVPHGMAYMGGSAKGADAVVSFSVDGGKTFHKAPTLTVDGARKAAPPRMYTNIKWTIRNILPGRSGSVSFKARVK